MKDLLSQVGLQLLLCCFGMLGARPALAQSPVGFEVQATPFLATPRVQAPELDLSFRNGFRFQLGLKLPFLDVGASLTALFVKREVELSSLTKLDSMRIHVSPKLETEVSENVLRILLPLEVVIPVAWDASSPAFHDATRYAVGLGVEIGRKEFLVGASGLFSAPFQSSKTHKVDDVEMRYESPSWWRAGMLLKSQPFDFLQLEGNLELLEFSNGKFVLPMEEKSIKHNAIWSGKVFGEGAVLGDLLWLGGGVTRVFTDVREEDVAFLSGERALEGSRDEVVLSVRARL